MHFILYSVFEIVDTRFWVFFQIVCVCNYLIRDQNLPFLAPAWSDYPTHFTNV